MKPIRYIKIDEILSRLLRHPLLENITKEDVIYYLVDFINICGYYPLYQHREDSIDIKDYRGMLPCNVISIDMVKDLKTGLCLRSMTDTFDSREIHYDKCCNSIPYGDFTWKLQGDIIYTSFKCGKIMVSYTTLETDEDGFPLLIDNSNFLKAFELYVKKNIFTVLFDEGKINMNVLNHTEQEYAFSAGQLRSEMTIPDMSEMESIKNMMTSFIQNNHHFVNGFRDLGGIQDNMKIR